jgi:hypothetical protein
VVDTAEAEPNKGASVVVIDDDLNVAVLRCYMQGAGLDIEIQGPPNNPANPLVDDLSSRIDPSRDPWRALAEAAMTTERERRRQLDDRMSAASAMLGRGGGRTEGGTPRQSLLRHLRR